MKKILSILITVLMLMQMFTFAVSSEEASMYVRWTGEGPGEIEFTTISSITEYEIRLYKNEELIVETSHGIGGYDITTVKTWFLDEITQNGTGTYRAEVLYADGVVVSTDNYYYKAPTDALAKTDYLEFNQEKSYVVWNAVEGAKLYDLAFCFSTDGGQSFWPVCSYILDAEEDGTFFDFFGNSEDELTWIEESYEQAIIAHNTTAENFIRAIQVVAYPAELNDANPSYSDYVTFDGMTIPDSGDDNVSDGSNQTMEIVDCQYEYYQGQEFYADLKVIVTADDGTETYTIISSKDCVVEGFDSYTPGWQTVTIWFGDQYVTCEVYVYETDATRPDYTVSFENVKTEYEYGEDFYIEVYRYIDGEKITVANDEWWVEGFDPYLPGWQEVTVFCENRVETYEVYVSQEQIYEVRIERLKKQYYVGEEISAEVCFETADGRHEFTEDFSVEGFDSHKLGEQLITISYGGYSEDFTVTVKAKPIIDENVTHIRIKNLKALYYLGEEFEADVYAYTEDGSCYMVEEYLYYDFDSSITDEQQVTVRYGDFTDDCVVCVYEEKLTEALSGTCGDKLTWTLDTNGVLTISGTGAMTNYEKTNAMPWYDNRGRIKEIIIEDGVTSIGKNAFAWSRSLESVELPDTVTEINDYAFYACKNLKNIIIPDSVTTIGSFAFCQCTRMEDVVFGGGLTIIGEDAFAHCISLTNVDIHSSIELERCVFRYCESLENINVDDSNPYYCSIDGNLFDKNKTTLIQYAIGKKDTSYEIPEGVTVIGEAAFDLCTNLTSITIPNSVTSVYEFAFRGCENLTDVYYNGTASEFYAIAVSDYNDPFNNATIHYISTPEPAVSVTFENVRTEYEYGEEFYIEVYQYTAEGEKVAVEGWEVHRFDSTVPGEQSVTVSYGDYSATFVVYVNDIENPTWWEYDAANFELIIKEEMGSYGYDLNAGTTEAPWANLAQEVETISIWDGVTSITDGVFINFTNLKVVNLGGTVNKIGICAFERCTALEYITMPDSVGYIAPRAFANSGLRAIDFGNGLTQIDSSAFQNCKFESISFPESLRTIGINAFISCKYLMKVYIPTSVKRIMSNAFNYCNMLTDVYYGGTQEEWDSINIDTNNDQLLNATIHFVGEEPMDTFTFENVKTDYEYGEEFYAEVWITDIEGNRWQAEDYELYGFDPYTPGWQTVTLRYDYYEQTFEVFVNEQEIEEPYIVSVDFELLRDSYSRGEELEVYVYENMSDGTCNRVYDYEIVNFDSTKIGTQMVTINYNGFGEQFVITVKATPTSTPGGGGSSGGGGGASVTTAPIITVSEEKCRVGNTVDVVVSISNNTGFTNLGLEISYDRALTLVNVTANSGAGATFTPAQTLDVYPYNFSFDAASDVAYNGELAILTFEVPEDTQPGDYFVNVDFYKGRDGDYVDGVSVNYNEAEEALGLCYESGFVNVYNYIPGDINGDGVVTNKDGTALLRYLAGWELEQIDMNALDTDGDGTVTNKDGTRLLKYLAGWDVEVH